MTRPSWLYRHANPSGLNMFLLESDTLGTLTDDDLLSVKITRGADDPLPGLAPSVVEFTVRGTRWPGVNSSVAVKLAEPYARTLDDDLTSTSSLRYRAKARVGAYDVHDSGGSTLSNTTTFTGAHWSSLLLNASRKIQPAAGALVTEVLRDALDHGDLTYNSTPQRYGMGVKGSTHDHLHAVEDWQPARDIFDKYGAGTGTQLRETRYGDVWIIDQLARLAEANSALTNTLPLLRRNGIAPATWRQSVEAANTQYTIVRRTATNEVLYTQEWPMPAGYVGSLVEPETVDWSNIVTTTENYRYYMNARNYASNWAELSLPAVRLNIGRLLSTGVDYDRAVAVQALRAEVGEPVLLSGDWPSAVRGRYHAGRITETITPAGWEIELGLQPASRVIGLNYEDSQKVPAYTWAQMTTDWASTAGSWASFAGPA